VLSWTIEYRQGSTDKNKIPAFPRIRRQKIGLPMKAISN
jgi:hypothetical protein